jgi:phenylalanyl-tRNA synthetase beta chain
VLGQVTPRVIAERGLSAHDEVYALEVDLDAAAAVQPSHRLAVEPLPRFPSVARDISILVADSLPAAAIREVIVGAAPPTLAGVTEFDRYQGKGVPEGQISLSLRLTFRSVDRTLTDGEVHAAMETVLAALSERCGAVQR